MAQPTVRPKGLILGFIVGIPFALFVILAAYWTLVPVYSADLQIPEIETTSTLRFYRTDDENVDHGRYLTIRTPRRVKTVSLSAFDWAHNSRTSIYLTPDRKIAIIEPDGDDILVASDTLTTEAARSPSDDWTYIGAFDFEIFPGRRERILRFVSAVEQAECIPRLFPEIHDWQARGAARRNHCDHYRGVIGNPPQ